MAAIGNSFMKSLSSQTLHTHYKTLRQ